MSNALRDQLLKAGLVNDKQLKQAVKEKRKETLQKQGQSKPGAVDESKLQAHKAQAEKAERDRQLNLQRKEAAEQKAIAAQIRQLIETNRQPKGDGDIPYNFVDDNKVKRIYISDKLRDQIGRGSLAIVKLDGQYELVPSEIGQKIRVRHEASVVLLNDPQQTANKDQGDDPYADYTIPDDLMW
jgi:uncharacterized protein YaiL (DUF2058 family)